MARHHGFATDFAVFGGLLVLSTLTLGLSFVLKGGPGMAVAFAIAAVKASMVAWFFMHLATESTSSRVAVVTAVALTVLLCGFVAADVETRDPVAIRVPDSLSEPR